MVFASTSFCFFFLPLMIGTYYIPVKKKGRDYKNFCLFLGSLFFYAWGEPIFVFIMLVSIFINWFLSIFINKMKSERRKVILAIAVILDLGLLFVFKYLTFLLSNINLLLFNSSKQVPYIALPIGISFFTFQMLSYILDVYYGNAEPQKKFLPLALYIAMFPQLIAGPIVRYDTIAEELNNRKENFDDFAKGLERFIFGLSKKVILANQLAIVADNAFEVSVTNETTICLSWLGAIAYTFQIYFDFSGYSDMAIGLGAMFGFHFNENFNYPYTATSVTDFWRKWHISLSSWFRDYVYIPLGGNRVGKKRQIWNLFVVWILTGFWHGANWTFVVWGLIYFIVLILEKNISFLTKMGNICSRIYTLLIVIVCWVFFKSTNLSEAVKYLGHMLGIGNSEAVGDKFLFWINNYKILFIISFIGCTPLMMNLWNKIKLLRFGEIILEIIKIIMLLTCVSYLLRGTYNPFVYFNF